MLDKLKKKNYQCDTKCADETNAVLVGGSYTQNFNKAVDVYDSINEVKLDHYVFDSLSGWKEPVSLKNPTVQLKASIDEQAYIQMNKNALNKFIAKSTLLKIRVAQSCLSDLDCYLKHCFKKSNLLPIKRKKVAVNREQIKIAGAIFMEMMTKDVNFIKFRVLNLPSLPFRFLTY